MVSQNAFDMQIWKAKSLMDLHQLNSRFCLAEMPNDEDMYTCWQGSRDDQPWAITVLQSGKSTGPTVDGSRIAGLDSFVYPPRYTCGQAEDRLRQSGITEAWIWCSLLKHPAFDPVYEFQFAVHATVFINAQTLQIMP